MVAKVFFRLVRGQAYSTPMEKKESRWRSVTWKGTYGTTLQFLVIASMMLSRLLLGEFRRAKL